jgi:hypothetical protein
MLGAASNPYHIANARLIAAAPELLAALAEVLAHVEDERVLRNPANQCTLCKHFRDKIRAAIAKAEGTEV